DTQEDHHGCPVLCQRAESFGIRNGSSAFNACEYDCLAYFGYSEFLPEKSCPGHCGRDAWHDFVSDARFPETLDLLRYSAVECSISCMQPYNQLAGFYGSLDDCNCIVECH